MAPTEGRLPGLNGGETAAGVPPCGSYILCLFYQVFQC